MKNKRLIIFTLGMFIFVANSKIISAKGTEVLELSNYVVARSRARQVNATNGISVGSSKYGNFTITIKVNGVVNMDSSGNAISDSLNFSYSCKYPITASADISYNSSKVKVFYYITVTYPDGTQQRIVQYYDY